MEEVQTTNNRDAENSMLPQDNGAQYWCFQYAANSYRPPAFNNGLDNRNRPFDIENGVLTKLADDSPAPCKVIDANNIRG